jgi:hypothetical protein
MDREMQLALERLKETFTAWQVYEDTLNDETSEPGACYSHCHEMVDELLKRGPGDSFDAYLGGIQPPGGDDSIPILCRECGQEMEIVEGGISHHLTAAGDVDHDRDADHVAVADLEDDDADSDD